MRTVMEGGRSFLIRVGSNVSLLRKLGFALQEHEGIVYLWPEKAQKKRQEPLVLRLITLCDGRNRKVHLLSNVLDATLLSDAEAAALYRRRWTVELIYRSLKQAMGNALPGRGRLDAALAAAVKDDYRRTGSKKARHWPHKKREKPPGDPKARNAKKAERTLAAELLAERRAAA